MTDDRLEYFIAETNRRLTHIEDKLDSLLEAKAQGKIIVVLISFIVSAAISLVLAGLR